MKIFLGLLCGVAVFPMALEAAESKPVVSEISGVTVYTDRARVTRTGHVTLSAGESEWIFDRLPEGILDASVQVSGRGVEGAAILDVTTRQGRAVAAVDPRLKGLEEQLQALETKARALKDRGDALAKQAELLGKIEDAVASPPAEKAGQPRPTFDEWQKLLAFSDDTRARLATSLRALEDEQRLSAAEIAAKRAEIDQLQQGSNNGRGFKTVTVRLSTPAAGPLDLSVTYAVVGASWRPTYDARLKSEDRQVELTYFGIVQQNTGEDWKQVPLVLSTAKPSLGGGAPELSPWLVDVVREEPTYGMGREKSKRSQIDKEAPGSVSVVSQEFMKDTGAMSSGALLAYTASTEAGGLRGSFSNEVTSASFVIATPSTVPSDNAPQKVGIASASMAATLKYETTPRLLEAAFLSASVQNSTEFPFLAGPVNVFLDDTFVTTAGLKSVMPTEKFDLAMGADEGLSVKRKVVNRFHEDTGLTGGGRRVTYEYLITVTNKKKTAEKLVLREVLPVSRDEKIVVKLLTPQEKELSNKDKPKDIAREEGGRLAWTLDLKPGEKREVTLKFSIDYPGDIRVEGLE